MTKIHEFELIYKGSSCFELHIFNTVSKQGIFIPLTEEEKEQLVRTLQDE